MRTINILFSDPDIPSYTIGEIICERFDFEYFVLGDELRQRISGNETDFTKEIKSFRDTGRVIPASIANQFVKDSLKEFENKDILLSGFPITIEHFNLLMNDLKDANIQLDQIWHIKPLKESAVENRQEYYLSRRKEINTIRSATSEIKWKVLELDRSDRKNKQLILDKINAIA